MGIPEDANIADFIVDLTCTKEEDCGFDQEEHIPPNLPELHQQYMFQSGGAALGIGGGSRMQSLLHPQQHYVNMHFRNHGLYNRQYTQSECGESLFSPPTQADTEELLERSTNNLPLIFSNDNHQQGLGVPENASSIALDKLAVGNNNEGPEVAEEHNNAEEEDEEEQLDFLLLRYKNSSLFKEMSIKVEQAASCTERSEVLGTPSGNHQVNMKEAILRIWIFNEPTSTFTLQCGYTNTLSKQVSILVRRSGSNIMRDKGGLIGSLGLTCGNLLFFGLLYMGLKVSNNSYDPSSLNYVQSQSAFMFQVVSGVCLLELDVLAIGETARKREWL